MNNQYQRSWMYPRRQSARPDQSITGIQQRQAIKKRYGVNPWLPNVYGNTQLLYSQNPKVAILGSFGWMRLNHKQRDRYQNNLYGFTARHFTMVLPLDNTQDMSALREVNHRHSPAIGVIPSSFQDVPAGAKAEASFGGRLLRGHGMIMSPFSNKRPVNLNSNGPYNWRNVWMSQFADMLYVPHASFTNNLKAYLAKHPGTNPAHYAEITHRPVFREPGANAATYIHYKTGKPILYTRQNNGPEVNQYLKQQSGAINTGAYFYGLDVQRRWGLNHPDYRPADNVKIIGEHLKNKQSTKQIDQKEAQKFTTPQASNRLVSHTFNAMEDADYTEARLAQKGLSAKERQHLLEHQKHLQRQIKHDKALIKFARPGLKRHLKEHFHGPHDQKTAEPGQDTDHAKRVAKRRKQLQDRGRVLYHHPKQFKRFNSDYLSNMGRKRQLEAHHHVNWPDGMTPKKFRHQIVTESWIMAGVHYESRFIKHRKMQIKVDRYHERAEKRSQALAERRKYAKNHPRYSIAHGKYPGLSKGSIDVLPPENATQSKSGIKMQPLPKADIARFKEHLRLLKDNGVRVTTSENVHGSDLVAKTENELKVPYGLYVNRKDLKTPKIKKSVAENQANGGGIGVMNRGTDAQRASDVAVNSNGLFLPRVTLKRSGGHYYPQEPGAKLALAAMKKIHKPVFIDPRNNSKKANALMEKDGAISIQSLEIAAHYDHQTKANKFAEKYTKAIVEAAKRLRHQHSKPGAKKPFLPVSGNTELLDHKHKVALVSLGALNSAHPKDYHAQKDRIRHAVNGLSAKKYTILTPLSTNSDDETAVQQTIKDKSPAVGFVATNDPKSSLYPNPREIGYYTQKPDPKLQAKYKRARSPKAFHKANPKLSEKDRQHQLKHYRARLNAYHHQPKAVVQAAVDKNTIKSVQKAVRSKNNKAALQNQSAKDIAKSLSSLSLRKAQTNALINSSNAVLVLGAHAADHQLIDDSLTHDAEPMLQRAKQEHKPIYFISKNNSQQARQVLQSKYGAKPISDLIGQAAATHEHVNARKELDHSFKIYEKQHAGKSQNKPLKHTSLSTEFDNLPEGNGKHPVTFDGTKSKSKPKKKDKGKGDGKGDDTPAF